MEDRSSSIGADFLQSYQDFGGINHISGPNLPSKQGVLSIIEDIEGLIFPGFKTEDAIDHGSLRFMVSEKINRLISKLSTEVTRSICYGRRIQQKGASCSGDDKLHFVCRKEAETYATELVAALPGIRAKIHKDVLAAYAGDPAAKSLEEVILSYPAVEAITIFRVAHQLWEMNVSLIPRMMTEIAHARTGIDIHPGATIGESFFIDHGTGVVIGETCVIGNNVKLYQGVTLGALSVRKEQANARRHPTLEDDVTVYSGATILGGKTVIGKGSIIGGNVWLTTSVAAGSRVVVKDAEYVVRNPADESQEYHI